RYVRRLVDTGIGGREVTLVLTVRRLFCDQPGCVRKTFAEQVPGLTTRHGRRTVPAAGVVESVAMALGGRAGARLVDRLALPTSRMTLLRVIRRVCDPPAATPRVLGVDDFAQRRGHRYATVLVDMHTHRPIDVLPDREADTLADWLQRHPGVEIICRDRGGAYAEGAARGAPDAIQVADRWHLMHNLSEAVRKVVTRHRRCLQQAAAQPAQEPTAAPEPATSGRRADNTRSRHAAVQALLAEGLTIRAIMQRLGISRGTVRKYARAQAPEQLLGPNPSSSPGKLGPFKPYLQARHDEGVTDSHALYVEIRDRGYRGTLRTLQRYLVQVRGVSRTPPPPPVPAARHITAWIMRPDDKLTDDDRLGLKDARARCADLDALTELAHGFNQLVRERGGRHLEEWIKQATDSSFPEMCGFAAGLLKDLDAVRAGLTQPWSSGAVEGNVNRIKMIKRQMYGRANLDLLRKRILAQP
ncbi:ISL3 family transposase, partial [Micromonospora sp. NPDC047548]|uniref:ISL3 family transposase n=1 Tax=Micromonospora sp. NPDC047548 TaxID=3155624 RepID=UPI0033F57085